MSTHLDPNTPITTAAQSLKTVGGAGVAIGSLITAAPDIAALAHYTIPQATWFHLVGVVAFVLGIFGIHIDASSRGPASIVPPAASVTPPVAPKQ